MPEAKRQLAAIMFTDIEGYTALMQQDESQAMAMRGRHRETGDGVNIAARPLGAFTFLKRYSTR